MRTRGLMLGVVVILAMCLCQPAAAQQRRYPYQPASPPISSYFDLLRVDTGGIPNYHAFLRPDQQLRRFVDRQQGLAEQQRRNLLSLERQFLLRRDLELQDALGKPQTLRLRQTLQGGPRAVPGSFQYYSHYYPLQTLPATGR